MLLLPILRLCSYSVFTLRWRWSSLLVAVPAPFCACACFTVPVHALYTTLSVLQAMDDEWYSATYPYSSPLLRSVRVMRRNHHSDGTKRARRARLNFLFGREHKTYAVDHTTRESADILREKKERKEVQKLGKVYIKAKTGPQAAAAAAAAAAGGAAGGKGGAKAGGKAAAGGTKAKK